MAALREEIRRLEARHERDLERVRTTAIESVARSAFEIVDGCDRVLTDLDARKAAGISTGIVMLRDQVLNELDRHDLRSVNPLGAAFDPHLHEAVGRRVGAPEGEVVEVLKRGWFLGERMLRAAAVVVGDGGGCPHGQSSPEACLSCFREGRRTRSDSEQRRRDRS